MAVAEAFIVAVASVVLDVLAVLVALTVLAALTVLDVITVSAVGEVNRSLKKFSYFMNKKVPLHDLSQGHFFFG